MNIVQIGANKGCDSINKGSDDFFNLIKNFSISKLILVEPLSIHIEDLKNRYSNIKNVFIENIAISDKSIKEIDFYYHEKDGPLYFVASTDPSHILKHGYPKEGLLKITVPSFCICDLFDKYDLLTIDVLCIDTEGLDGDIIKSINFEKYKIKEIYYEHTHQKFDISEFLIKNGYEIKPSWSDTYRAISIQ